MPSIPIYNAPTPDVNVSDLGAEAWNVAARHIGTIGERVAQDTKNAGEKIAAGLKDIGDTLQQHQDFADTINGNRAFSELARAHDQETRQLIANTPSDQLPQALGDAFARHNQDYDNLYSRFGNSSDKVKLWASEQVDRHKTDLQKRFEGDAANATASSIEDSSNKTVSNAISLMGDQPTTSGLDQALHIIQQQRDALDHSPLGIDQKAKLREHFDNVLQSTAQDGIKRMLDADPSRLDDLMKQYAPYIKNPVTDYEIREHARTTQKRLDSEQALKIRDGIVNDFLGVTAPNTNTPQSAPDELWSRVKGAEGGLDRNGNPLTSPKGAIGISQIIPSTARDVASQLGLPYDKQRLYTDQAYNEKLGRQYLSNMLDRYGGNQTLATAAYNAGPGNVDKWLQAIGDPRDGSISDRDWASRIPIDETRKYTLGIMSSPTPQPSIAANPPKYPSPVSPSVSSGAVAVGDSIAAHMIRFAGVGGKENRTKLLDWSNGATAAGGSAPELIRDNIKAMPDDVVKGKPVILSTGASNTLSAPTQQQVDLINEQIDLLRDKGATRITLLGVGPNDKIAGWNDKLKDIAADKGAAFAGALTNTQPDQIHLTPAGYKQLALSINQPGTATPAQPQPQPGQPPQAGQQPQAGQPPAAPNNALQPFPSREQMIAKIPATVSPEQRVAIVHGIDEARSELLKRTEEERTSLAQEITGGLEKLKQGNEFDYDENTIRHYFEPKAADKLVSLLGEAKDVGKQIQTIRETPVQDVLTTINDLNDSLKTAPAGTYAERYKMVHAYYEAAKLHLESLGIWPGQKNADQADPVQYLATQYPDLRGKAAALASDDPNATADYANSIISTQAQLGVPPERQRILSNDVAQSIAHSIIADPGTANNTIDGLKAKWGDAYDHVWSDLVTHGHLPAAYQVMEAISEPKDKWLLARGLTEQVNGNKRGNENFWTDVLGEKQYNELRTTMRNNDDFKNFARSLMNSGASRSQIDGLVQGVDTLAFSKAAFEPGGDPAGDAVKAIVKNYDFSMPGGARVPVNVIDNVKANASELLNGLDLNSISVPPGYGGIGQPSKAAYLATVKGAPTWITTPKEDGVQLIDTSGKAVLDDRGDPIRIPFNMPVTVRPYTPPPIEAVTP